MTTMGLYMGLVMGRAEDAFDRAMAPQRAAEVVDHAVADMADRPVEAAARCISAVWRAFSDVNQYGAWWADYQVGLSVLGSDEDLKAGSLQRDDEVLAPDDLEETICHTVSDLVRKRLKWDGPCPDGWTREAVIRFLAAFHALVLCSHELALALRMGCNLDDGTAVLDDGFCAAGIDIIGIQSVLWGMALGEGGDVPNSLMLDLARRARKFVGSPPAHIPCLVAVKPADEFGGYAAWAYTADVVNPFAHDRQTRQWIADGVLDAIRLAPTVDNHGVW